MHAALPLITHHDLSQPIAWRDEGVISASGYLRDVRDLAQRLPRCRYVLNLCDDRYRFMVAFGAALVNGQTCVLPPNHAERVLSQVREVCADLICITDHPHVAEAFAYPEDLGVNDEEDAPVPLIAADHIAALVFTSGSTGDPRPNAKAWGRLVAGAQSERLALGLDEGRYAYLGTVPPQHMYGFETTVLLPMQTGGAVHASRPLFARDVAACLTQLPAPRVLVTTPIHIRALLEEQVQLPQLQRIVSAAAPLAVGLAEECEERHSCELREIYGFTEAGMIATRRTVRDSVWRLMPGLHLEEEERTWFVHGAHVNGRLPFSDLIEVQEGGQFRLIGRAQDVVNIAGKRASLGDLNHKLNQVPGVRDGVFHMPNAEGRRVERLMAFVVAPELSEAEILAALRPLIDPAFLPRPLIKVSALPRTPSGKLPIDRLREMEAMASAT